MTTVVHAHPIRETRRLRFEPTHRAASAARQEARRALHACGVPSEVVDDLELIVAELASNAVEQQPRSPVRLEMEVSENSVTLTMTNQVTGPERPVQPNGRPSESSDRGLADRGRGLAIVDALCDGLWIEEDDRWISVRVLRRYRGRQ